MKFDKSSLNEWINEIEKNFGSPLSADLETAFRGVVDGLDQGLVRVMEKRGSEWIMNEWAKKAILLWFKHTPSATISCGDLKYFDKLPLKNPKESKFRAVPVGTARYGAYLAPGVILMPSFVNIGAYVDEGTMVDTWATVGSCAQVGKNVHLSGGVGIGGVLEPLQAKPVVIEDNCFIGSRAVIVEGAHVEERAVIGANVVITGSTKVIDVTGSTEKIYRGFVPADSVVIPGTTKKLFTAGEYQVPCALIIGKRKASTDLKTSLNETLRDYEIS